MSQPDDTPTPDVEALRDTRPSDDDAGDELATHAGPATAGENAVDEDLGRADR